MTDSSGTSSQTDAPSRLIAMLVLGIHERAAPGRDDRVPQRQHQAQQDLALGGAEVGLAVLREHVGDGQPLARLDQLVDVFGAPAEPRREQRARPSSCPRP